MTPFLFEEKAVRFFSDFPLPPLTFHLYLDESRQLRFIVECSAAQGDHFVALTCITIITIPISDHFF